MAEEGVNASTTEIPDQSVAPEDVREEAVKDDDGGAATENVNEEGGIEGQSKDEPMELEQTNKRTREGNDDDEADDPSKKRRVEADGDDQNGGEKSVEETRLEEMGVEECLQADKDDALPKAEEAEGDEGADDGNGKAKEEEEKKEGPVKLGPKVFVSSLEMFDYFFNILHNWPVNLNLNKYEHMVLSDLLIKGHHESDKKVGPGIKAFQIRVHPMWHSRCYCLIRNDDTIDDFSYRKCVDSLLPLPENMKVSGNLGSKDNKGHKQSKDGQRSGDGRRGFGGDRRGGGGGRGHGRRGRGRGRSRG